MAREPSQLANRLSDDDDHRSGDEEPPRDNEVTPEQIRLFQHHFCGGEAVDDRDMGALAIAVKLICHLKRAPPERDLKDWCNYAHHLAQPVSTTWVFNEFAKKNKIPTKSHVKAQKKIDKLQAVLEKRKKYYKLKKKQDELKKKKEEDELKKKRDKLRKRREIFKRLQASGQELNRRILMAEFHRVESGEAE